MRLKSLAFVLVTAFMSTVANAATYYVAPGGNDAGAGSLAAPFRTINRAVAVVAPGDTVNVRAGVYSEVVKLSSTGTAAARITFRSYPGERAVIDGTGSAFNTNLVQVTGAYVDVVGFEVRNSTRIGIDSRGANNVRVADNIVHSNFRGGILITNAPNRPATDVVVEGNEVYNNALQNQYHNSTEGWGQALGLYYTSRTKVLNNKVYKNHGEGIDFIMSDYGVAEGNEVFDNYGVNIYVDNGRFITINRNLMYSTGDTKYFRNGHPASSIALQNEVYATPNLTTDITITNNIGVYGLCGIYYGNYGRGGGVRNTVIANNTFYRATWGLIIFETAVHQNSRIENNILYQVGGGEMISQDLGAGVAVRSNHWYGGNAGKSTSATDTLGDPRFVRAGGTNAADYKLTAASPAIDRGLNLASLLSTDYFGAARNAAFDLGAHELSAGVSDTVKPAAPRNFRANVTGTAVTLLWDAATDNLGVTAYQVYRNGIRIATVANVLTYTDPNGAATATSGEIVYHVTAIDAAGNESPLSDGIATSARPATMDPTAPGSLRGEITAALTVTLDWNASKDDSEIVYYEVYRDGKAIAKISGRRTRFVDTRLEAGKTYLWSVAAIDADGVRSKESGMVKITMPAVQKRRSSRK